jgi:hypothetical protein
MSREASPLQMIMHERRRLGLVALIQCLHDIGHGERTGGQTASEALEGVPRLNGFVTLAMSAATLSSGVSRAQSVRLPRERYRA